MEWKRDELIWHLVGNMPVIVSCHHDGVLKKVCGHELPRLRNTKNDEGTKNFVLKAALFFSDVLHCGKKPHILIFDVAKSRSSEDMLTLYFFKLFEIIGRCIEEWGRCFVFDIHRFHKHPLMLDEYDIWFGTDYRGTVNGTFDFDFAINFSRAFKAIAGRELDIYVPSEEPVEGERFMATGKDPSRRIVTKIISEAAKLLRISNRLNAIQIEIYKDMISRDAQTEALAKAFAQAISQIS